MSAAAGAYFKTLREKQGLSQEALGKKIDLSGKQVYNWERGTSFPGGETLVALMEIIGGSFDHLRILFQQKSNEQLGEDLANEWLSVSDHVEFSQIATKAQASGKLAELISIIEQLESDPEALDRLAGYSQSLLDLGSLQNSFDNCEITGLRFAYDDVNNQDNK
jgi:transcriptional regulator with XRE-family HTH domain